MLGTPAVACADRNGAARLDGGPLTPPRNDIPTLCQGEPPLAVAGRSHGFSGDAADSFCDKLCGSLSGNELVWVHRLITLRSL